MSKIEVPFAATIVEWTPKRSPSDKMFANCKLNTEHFIAITAENFGFRSQYQQYFECDTAKLWKDGKNFASSLDKVIKMRCIFYFTYQIARSIKDETVIYGQIRFGSFKGLKGFSLGAANGR